MYFFHNFLMFLIVFHQANACASTRSRVEIHKKALLPLQIIVIRNGCTLCAWYWITPSNFFSWQQIFFCEAPLLVLFFLMGCLMTSLLPSTGSLLLQNFAALYCSCLGLNALLASPRYKGLH